MKDFVRLDQNEGLKADGAFRKVYNKLDEETAWKYADDPSLYHEAYLEAEQHWRKK